MVVVSVWCGVVGGGARVCVLLLFCRMVTSLPLAEKKNQTRRSFPDTSDAGKIFSFFFTYNDDRDGTELEEIPGPWETHRGGFSVSSTLYPHGGRGSGGHRFLTTTYTTCTCTKSNETCNIISYYENWDG